jgi:hypothetical protein
VALKDRGKLTGERRNKRERKAGGYNRLKWNTAEIHVNNEMKVERKGGNNSQKVRLKRRGNGNERRLKL